MCTSYAERARARSCRARTPAPQQTGCDCHRARFQKSSSPRDAGLLLAVSVVDQRRDAPGELVRAKPGGLLAPILYVDVVGKPMIVRAKLAAVGVRELDRRL
jgi:hypothetical protein